MGLIRGFFFDLDGTLVDTYESDYQAYRAATKEVLGVELVQKAYNKLHGMEMRDKFKILVPDITDEQLDRLAANKKTQLPKFIHLSKPNTILINWLKDMSRHYATVLITNAKPDNANLVLDTHNIRPYFSHFVFGDEVTHPKPHPEHYLIGLKRTGLKPEEAIALEDSASGIESASRAGIAVIHVRSFV